MTDHQFPVVCYGEVLWDILPDGPQAGGAPLNVCYHLNKLGLQGAMISSVGDDENGRKLSNLMSLAGIPLDLIQTDTQHKTGEVIAAINDSEEVSYTIISPVAWDFINYNPAQQQAISPAGYFVYGSLAARSQTSRDTLFKLLETNATKVFDVNLRAPNFSAPVLKHLLSQANIVKCNREEIAIIAGLFGGPKHEKDQVDFLMNEFGISELILTKGGEGAFYFKAAETFSAKPPVIKINDTIGSGDSFLAAFIVGHQALKPPQVSLDNAVAMGAFVASKKGGCPDYNLPQYHHFLNNSIKL